MLIVNINNKEIPIKALVPTNLDNGSYFIVSNANGGFCSCLVFKHKQECSHLDAVKKKYEKRRLNN